MGSGAATRNQIVEAADRLIYQQGFEHTSFSEIAGEVGISRGNFYYHFRSKEEILHSVIDARLATTAEMLERWASEEPEPDDRIRRFIDILLVNSEDIQNHGCPVGTLTTELAKLDHAALSQAGEVFTLFRSWLRDQFTLLGHEAEADVLALRLLAFSQGVATLANAFKDEDFIQREVQQLHWWLSTYTGDHATH